jgi:hypothetical protein
MISGILSQVTGQLESRFLLNAFFPTLVFLLAMGLAVAAGAGGTAAAIALWDGLDVTTKALLAIGAVALVFLLANLLSSGMLQVVGLFEGYVWPVRLVAPWARNRELDRAGKLLGKASQKKEDGGKRNEDEAERLEDKLERRFPVWPRTLTASDVAPTRLGNVLLSAETYSLDRYGVDSVRTWPRLYHLLPKELVESMAQARASMEFLLAMAFLAALYAPTASIYLIVTAASPVWWIVSLFAASAISIAAYAAALWPAAVYGDHVRAAFDLHRRKLLTAAGMPLPATPAEERRTWEVLTSFLERGRKHSGWRYVFPSE